MGRLSRSVYKTYVILRRERKADIWSLSKIRGLSKYQLYRHLKILRLTGAVEMSREGRKVFYNHSKNLTYSHLLTTVKRLRRQSRARS